MQQADFYLLARSETLEYIMGFIVACFSPVRLGVPLIFQALALRRSRLRDCGKIRVYIDANSKVKRATKIV